MLVLRTSCSRVHGARNSQHRPADPCRFADANLHRREMTLLGSRNATDEDFTTVISAIRNGRVDPDALVTHRTNWAAAAQDLPRWPHEMTGLIKGFVGID